MSLIFHVDVNNAFLSWEAVFRLRYLHENLDIRTIPSAIGGDRESRHGIILAKSTPAKAYGIKTAETINDALRKCPELVLFESRFDFYRECSHAFMDILREYTDLVEPFSIDEAFVDLSGCTEACESPVSFADRVRERIKSELGFTVNIGISENKLLAKMASDFTKPDRVHTLFPDEIPSKMWPLPVSDLLFVGASSTKHLNDLGIRTIGALAHTDLKILEAHFGKSAVWLHSASNGKDSSPVTVEHSDNKGYSNSTTLPSNLTTAEEACRILLQLSENIGIRLRHDNAKIKVLGVSIRDGDFGKKMHQKTLPTATDITSELYSHACSLFTKMWDGRPIRALGIHTSNIADEDRQLTLFDSTDYSKAAQADKLMDSLRDRFGKDIVKRASLISPPDKKRTADVHIDKKRISDADTDIKKTSDADI